VSAREVARKSVSFPAASTRDGRHRRIGHVVLVSVHGGGTKRNQDDLRMVFLKEFAFAQKLISLISRLWGTVVSGSYCQALAVHTCYRKSSVRVAMPTSSL
jgi:hypothetical protein